MLSPTDSYAYKLVRLIDQGQFCRLYLVQRQKSGETPQFEVPRGAEWKSEPGGLLVLKIWDFPLPEVKILTSGILDNPEHVASDQEEDKALQEAQRKILVQNQKTLELNHPNIVRHWHFHIQERTPLEPARLLSFMDRYDCSLAAYLQTPAQQELTFEIIAHLLFEVLKGLIFFHGKTRTHSDIKAENIFLLLAKDGYPRAAIGDAADLQTLVDGLKTGPGDGKDANGTIPFMSLELLLNKLTASDRSIEEIEALETRPSLQGRPDVGRRTDVWSLGCLAIQILQGGQWPFLKNSVDGTTYPNQELAIDAKSAKLLMIEQQEFLRTEGVAPSIPETSVFGEARGPLMLAFIQRCLVKDVEQRPYAPDLQQDPLFSRCRNDLLTITQCI